MSLNQEVDALRRLPLFQRIEPRRLKLLAFTSERMVFPAGEDIVRQGDPGDSAYIVLAGEADVFVASASGELKVATLGCNDIIGEIAILIDIPRTATVRAASDLTTLRISKEHFFRLVTEVPEMGIEIMKELARRLEKTTADLREARAA
ncbi:MAG: cyclic nucleotide-binding domain-containing protein [Alphaproteobacteria bacterium]|nr:cyclic nucleotide-binding domain-containing protein [Alphaproteobacteria bacterium]MCB9930147.1 cyclic nucleotide-binding domain-containing protein [Alphaproteobacteria bacterium]